MLNSGARKLARFNVEVELANNDDVIAAKLGNIAADKVRRVKVQGLVDCGATRLVLPQAVAGQLGLVSTSNRKVTYANGSSAERPWVEGIFLELLGRHGVYAATIEPGRDIALIGALVLEDLDFLIDPLKERLYPRDAKAELVEIG
jgi:predicted aspartyl protease